MLMRDDPHLVFTFDGGQANEQKIRMYEVGTALIGIDRLLTTGLHHITSGKTIAPRAPQPFVIRTSSPGDGSIEIPVWLTSSAIVTLPIIEALCVEGASKVLWLLASTVLTRNANREKESADYIGKLLDHLGAVEAHRHIENMEWAKLANHASRVVEPVGRSCDEMSITSEDDETIDFDSIDADAIRFNVTHRMGALNEIQLEIDGFTSHNRQLKVKNPEFPDRFVTAYVRDPAFNTSPNVYTIAATHRANLRVLARVARNKSNGSIRAIYIYKAIGDPHENSN